MITVIQKWGNSQGIRLPKQLLEEAQLNCNDEVEIEVLPISNAILIKKGRKNRHIKLSERFADFDGEYNTKEVDWGNPKGNEIW